MHTQRKLSVDINLSDIIQKLNKDNSKKRNNVYIITWHETYSLWNDTWTEQSPYDIFNVTELYNKGYHHPRPANQI